MKTVLPFAVDYDPHQKPYLCHGASPTNKCGSPNNDSSVPAPVAQANKLIKQCIGASRPIRRFALFSLLLTNPRFLLAAAGNSSSQPGFATCVKECQEAFVTYITYGDLNLCFAFEGAKNHCSGIFCAATPGR